MKSPGRRATAAACAGHWLWVGKGHTTLRDQGTRVVGPKWRTVTYAYGMKRVGRPQSTGFVTRAFKTHAEAIVSLNRFPKHRGRRYYKIVPLTRREAVR